MTDEEVTMGISNMCRIQHLLHLSECTKYYHCCSFSSDYISQWSSSVLLHMLITLSG